MPPSSSPPSSGSTLKRKQPTISSFFTKKTPASQGASSNHTEPHERPNGHVREGNGNARNVRHFVDDDGDGGNSKVPPAAKRTKTSAQPVKVDVSVDRSSPVEPSPQSRRAPLSNSSQRTDQFRFGGSSVPEGRSHAEDHDDDHHHMEQAKREKLHQRFIRKLGGPECLIGIESRAADGVVAEYGEDAADDEDEEPQLSAVKGKAKPSSKKEASKLTPLEKQVIDIKRKHPDTVLVVEVGYKFRFFGEDARTAAKELSIVCIPGKMRFDERMEDTSCFLSCSLADLHVFCIY